MIEGHESNAHPGTVRDVVCLGAVDDVLVALDGGPELTAQTRADDHPGLDARCRLIVPPDSVIVWSGRGITTSTDDRSNQRRTEDFTMPDLYHLSTQSPQ